MLTRTIHEPNLSNFGRWTTTQPWREVFTATTTDEKADAFYSPPDLCHRQVLPQLKLSNYTTVTNPAKHPESIT